LENVWLKRYPPNVPTTINLEQYRSLVEVFERSCCQFGRRNAFASMGHSISYNELEQKSRAFAVYLQQELGLVKGERVAIMLPNVLQYPVALFGVLRAGLVAVSINPMATPEELQYRLRDSGAKTILIVANFAYVLAKVIEETDIKKTIITEIGDLLPYWKAKVVNLVSKHIKRLVPDYSLSNTIRFNEVLNIGNSRQLQSIAITGEDLALIHYKQSAEGVARGVMLAHRNMVANIQQIVACIGPAWREGEEVMMTALPLHHIFCLTLNCLCVLYYGGLNVFITNPHNIPLFVSEMRQRKFTAITGFNALFAALLKNKKFLQLDFSSFRLAIGGFRVRQAVAERWQAVTGLPIIGGYGLTEASPMVCMGPVDLSEFNGSVGLPLPSTEIELRDGAGEQVPLGERGELCVRGPQVMRGYWRLPEATAGAIRDGWLLTGDVATMDQQGFIRIIDRKEDRLVVSGFNVFPKEIEEVVLGCEGVLEVACIGIADDKTGEAIKVFVVRKPDVDLSGETIIAYCRQRLSAYQVPRHIEFRDSLPKSSAGKVLRRDLH